MMSSDIVLGDEALRLGLIQRCCDGDALEQAVAFAQQLADTVSPTSLAAMKRQIWTHPLMDDEAALAQSIDLMNASLRPENMDFKVGGPGPPHTRLAILKKRLDASFSDTATRPNPVPRRACARSSRSGSRSSAA